MARDQDAVIDAMVESVNEIDPTIDVTKGPIYEGALVPWGREISSTERQVEHLSELYQLEIVDTFDQEEIDLIGRNFGQEYGEGESSRGALTFYAYSTPLTDIIIPVGTLVSTEDGEYTYRTIDEATIYSDNADAFLNEATKRYEVTVTGEATQRGSEFDAKEGRIDTILTAIEGISGVISTSDFEGGTPDQTIAEFAEDLLELPLGNSLGTPGGLQAIALRTSLGKIQDSVIVTPADTDVYERYSVTGMRMAIDLYIIGTKITPDEYAYTTVASETRIVIPNAPVAYVTSVFVDGSSVAYSFVPDTNRAVRGSVQAEDAVVLDSAPGPGKSVVVSYAYNSIIEDIQNELGPLDADLFNANTLVREGKQVPTTVQITISSFGAGTRKTDVEEYITNFFKDPTRLTDRQTFVIEIDPSDLREALESELVVTVQSIDFFNRPDRATSDVQTIIYAKNEYPDLDLTVVSAPG